MAHKTFISYKYSESCDLRDKIIESLGEDAKYYKGENVDSPNMTGENVDKIKRNLSNMIYDTSVMIVILSPNMKKSDWMSWEISYSLKETSRVGRSSRQNGIVAVVKKVNGSYDWLISTNFDENVGFNVNTYKKDLLLDIIRKNIFNSSPKVNACKSGCIQYDGHSQCAECSIYDSVNGSYISIVKEENFLSNPSIYIDQAYEKSLHKERFATVVEI